MLTENVPVFLTVEEAARVLRICRTAAYQQAHRWLDTDGREGLPVRKLGSSLRVPTAEFAEHFGVRVEDIRAALTIEPRKLSTDASQDVPVLDSDPVALGPRPAPPRRACHSAAERHCRLVRVTSDLPRPG